MKKFYDNIRKSLYNGSIPQSAVTSVDCIIASCKQHRVESLAQVAYVLATAYHEVGPDLKPVGENLNYSAEGLLQTWPTRFNVTTAKQYARQPVKIANFVYANRMGNGNEASGDGWRYRGRDYCQTTGKDNYARAGKYAGIDLVKFPDRIAEPQIACHTIVVGMKEGWFTGKKLSDYIPATILPGTDLLKMFIRCRPIINGKDKAEKIAEHALKFYKALTL